MQRFFDLISHNIKTKWSCHMHTCGCRPVRVPTMTHNVDGWVHVHCLSGEEMATDALWEEGRLAEAVWCLGNVCWETLGSGIHMGVTLIRTTYPKIVAGHVRPFMVFPYQWPLSEDNAPTTLKKLFMVWGTQQEFKELPWPPNPDLNAIEYLWHVLDQEIPSKEAPLLTFRTCR